MTWDPDSDDDPNYEDDEECSGLRGAPGGGGGGGDDDDGSTGNAATATAEAVEDEFDQGEYSAVMDQQLAVTSMGESFERFASSSTVEPSPTKERSAATKTELLT